MKRIITPDGIKKQCTKCKEYKFATPENFWRKRDCSDGLGARCIDCERVPKKSIEHIPDGYKRCTKCKEIKLANPDFFSRDKKAASGLLTFCRDCQGFTKPSPPKCDIPGYKPCFKCLQNFPATTEYFPATRWISSGLNSYCYPCDKRENAMQASRKRAKKRAAEGKHTFRDIQEQYQRQKSKCYYCRDKVKWGEHHVDHVVPLSRGGSNDISNLVIACAHCNHKKHKKLPHEWPEGGRLM